MNDNRNLHESMTTDFGTSGAYRFWPVNWSGVFVGSLAALATALILGLASIAVGAQIVGQGEHVVSWNRVNFGGIICTVCGAFFSYVVGGWVAGKITGDTRPETTMLHGAVAWLVTIPLILMFTALGAGGYFGAWYPGLAGTPTWSTATSSLPASDAAAIVRNNALGALTALLLGLIGSVLGGWMASGQHMMFGWNAHQSDHNVAQPIHPSQTTPAHTS